MKKYLKFYFWVSVIAFSALVLIPLIAWLVMQAVFSFGDLLDAYNLFLSGFFSKDVAEGITVFTFVVFFGSFLFGTFLVWIGLPD